MKITENRFITKCETMHKSYANINHDYKKTISQNTKKYFNIVTDKIQLIEGSINDLAMEQARILESVINRVNINFDEHGFPKDLERSKTDMLDAKIQALVRKVELMSFD